MTQRRNNVHSRALGPPFATQQATRRDWLKRAGAFSALLLMPRFALADEIPAADPDDSLIREITRTTLFAGRQGGTSWFHPRACRIPDSSGGAAIGMTMQSIAGSDVFGPVHWTETDARGDAWSRPTPIAGFDRHAATQGYEEGVCDVVPEYHVASGTVLVMGHNVFYRDNVLARPQLRRFPVYAVRRADGTWTAPARLEWNDERAAFIYSCGCAQRLELPNGEVLVPLTFGATAEGARSVTTVRCTFDGERLEVRETGSTLTNPFKRGLLEPSLARLEGRYYLTIRAEDERGHVATSDDGLAWTEQKPWTWDDGEPLAMSTTQQRWLPHSDGLFLVYTRRDASNEKVFRWRAPLFVAEVDRERLCLIRASERILLPLSGDARSDPKGVARMGNFHTVAATPDESWITVGEGRPADGWRGDTLLARVHWQTPNRLVDSAA
ncbi:MAG: exo-alpha-sialidase [Pirellulales bacterium]|nr:exo-alpha-sialidase [Pirellulales bacterium]